MQRTHYLRLFGKLRLCFQQACLTRHLHFLFPQALIRRLRTNFVSYLFTDRLFSIKRSELAVSLGDKVVLFLPKDIKLLAFLLALLVERFV